MHIGIDLGFGNLRENLSDAAMYAGEVGLADMAERLGFDSVWAVEHHFSDYAMCPNNIVFLAHVAGRTERVKLGTAAVIVPWHDPLRVAENMIMLDILSDGRALLGLGRGLSRTEYAPFQIPMDQSRGRFDEAAAMIVQALETGYIEGAGPYYPQPRTALRPRPRASFADRMYCAAGSPDSIASAVTLGAGLLAFVTKPVTENMDLFTGYRDQYRATHNMEAPPILCTINLYCHEDGNLARERAHGWIERYFHSHVKHYEMAGDHFQHITGYQRHAEMAEALRDVGLDKAADRYAASALVGTPDEIIEKITDVHRTLGGFALAVSPAYGGMPYEDAERSLELFGKEVLPAARRLGE
ncbi:LLM class flavin-dependent oxidoreductase [Frankia sp. Cr2]|uniref:LLM class flavin-dependent oxidoreductase n=1 Tax=Frankia sp. Cr2 TaxID=3073932 RepID=UPI002AD3BDA0|nr:LLM class flavin-dependent oxidoreductase [Frankia sp. Cr2]